VPSSCQKVISGSEPTPTSRVICGISGLDSKNVRNASGDSHSSSTMISPPSALPRNLWWIAPSSPARALTACTRAPPSFTTSCRRAGSA
jgi:hypothetical protein